MLVCKLGSFQREIWNWPQYLEVKEKLKKEADSSRLVGGSFNKRGNLQALSFVAARRVGLYTTSQNRKFM